MAGMEIQKWLNTICYNSETSVTDLTLGLTDNSNICWICYTNYIEISGIQFNPITHTKIKCSEKHNIIRT